MKQLFVDDYIEGILSAWYTRAALWGSAGKAVAPRCEFCHDSALAEVIDLTFWPHELLHHLAVSVESSVERVAASIAEEGTDDDTARVAEHDTTVARSMVVASLGNHSDDMLDVLEQCLRHRDSTGEPSEFASVG